MVNRYALWIMVGVLLLGVYLAAPGLNADAFSHDEVRTLFLSGGAHYGSLSLPVGVWERVAAESPDQALGFPLIAALWGRFAGWGELNVRVLSLLLGTLGIALTYRTARELFGVRIAVIAALILATSIVYLTYWHKFRVYTLALVVVALALWSYWRIITREHPPSLPTPIALVAAGIGLCYTHYFVTPLLAVLGLYHLLFVPKTRRWWLPVLLFVPVLLAFIPAIPVLLNGLAFNQGFDHLSDKSLTPFGIVTVLFTYFSGGWYALLGILIGGALAVPQSIYPRHCAKLQPVFFVGFILIGHLILIMILNAISGVFVPWRLRYLMGLWVPLTLIAAVGIGEIRRWSQWGALALLGVWLGHGIGLTVDGSFMIIDQGDDRAVLPWREVSPILFDYVQPDDVVLFQAGFYSNRFGHYTHGIGVARPSVYHSEGEEKVAAGVGDADRVWWLLDSHADDLNTAQVEEYMGGRYHDCGLFFAHEWMELRLFSREPIGCPGGDPRFTFADQIALTQSHTRIEGGTLHLITGWQIADTVPADTYSVGFYLLDDANSVLAQSDYGLPDVRYGVVRGEIDVSAVPSGSYTLAAAVYNWQTLERLSGSDDTHSDTLFTVTTITR